MTSASLVDGGAGHAVGDVLAERYEIEATLGRGAMGTVYRALDRRTHQPVAVKALDDASPGLLVYFKREFREFADVRHPNLVRLDELFEAGGRVYFSMELVDGVDLLTWVRPDGHLRAARLRAALRQLAAGLTALHDASRVHRDLKPANVLVDRIGRVVVLDFGLAARVDEGAPPDDVTVVGTAAYMAPEQAAGAPAGPRTDWYAVGAMMFEALTGRLPFEGDKAEVRARKRREDAPDPATVAPDAPEDLVALCRALLARTPEARPHPADMVQRLAAGRRAALTRAPAPVAFVGRAAELAQLTGAFADARREPVLTLVLGESGLGKTALVQAFLASLRGDAEPLVLAGRCHERETLPFKAFDGIADELARQLARWPDADVEAVLPAGREFLGALFPALDVVPAIGRARPVGGPAGADLDQREARRQAFVAFAELLRALGARRRVILVIDDLHRADPDSVDLLAEIMRAGRGPGLLLIGTARAAPTIDAVLALGATGEVAAPRVLRLGPLDDGPALELVRVALSRGGGAAPAASEAQIVSESFRHPGFILELARATHGATHRPSSLDAVIMTRVERLPIAQRAVLEILAVAEAPVSLAVLTAAAGQPRATMSGIVDALDAAELITIYGRADDDWVEAYHDRVAEAVRDRLDPDGSAAAHLALARALEADDAGDPERVLSHYLASREHGAVRRLAIVAAHRAAASMQHRRAVRLCRLALLHDPGAAEAEVLHRAAATALASLGSAREAAAHYLDVATLAAARRDPAAAREARRQAADQLLLAGEVRDGVELLDGVLRDVGLGRARGPATALARMIWARGRLRLRGHALAERTRPISSDERAQLDACWSAGLGLGMVDTLRGADYQARFVRLALASGDPALAVRGLALEAAYVATGGVARRAAVRALLAQAASLASTDHDRGWIELGGAIAALLQFEPGRAIVAADRAVAAFVGRAGAGIWEQRNARLYAMRPRWWSGRLRDLAARVRADVADARAHGDHYSLVQLLAGVGSMVWLVDDDLATYWTNLEEARALWSAPTFQLPDYYRVSSEVRGHGYAGDGPAAWRVIEAAWPALERSLILRTELIRADALALRGGAAVAAARAGAGAGRARLHAAAVRIAAQLAQIDAGYAHGTAAALRAAVATQRGDDAIASAELTRAAAAFADAGLPVYTAAARWQAAHRAHPAASAHDPLTAQLTDLGVRAPARFVGMLLPGLD